MLPKLLRPVRAKTRVDVFPEHMINFTGITERHEGANASLKFQALHELTFDLSTAGLTIMESCVFVGTLWRAGMLLDVRVSAANVARSMGKRRCVVSRVMKGLRSLGVLEAVNPNDRPILWNFPTYDELIRRIKGEVDEWCG